MCELSCLGANKVEMLLWQIEHFTQKMSQLIAEGVHGYALSEDYLLVYYYGLLILLKQEMVYCL